MSNNTKKSGNKAAKVAVADKKSEVDANQPQVESRQFTGLYPNKISESYCFGPESRAYMSNEFKWLSGKNYNLTMTEPHFHAYAAFCRKHFNAAIVKGGFAGLKVIDVGGHAIRTAVSTDNDGKTRWTARVHSTLPKMDDNDHLRHARWQHLLLLKDRQYGGYSFPIQNSCICVATDKGVCDCYDELKGAEKVRLADTAEGFLSIDSAYYPGVITGIEAEQIRKPRPAYYAFHDYYTPYLAGNHSYKTFDNEAEIAIRTKNGLMVESTVQGNPFPYTHQIIQTDKSVWNRYYPDADKTIIYQVERRLKQGAHDYLLVSSYCVPGNVQIGQRIQEVFARHIIDIDPVRFVSEQTSKVLNNLKQLATRVKGLTVSLDDKEKISAWYRGKRFVSKSDLILYAVKNLASKYQNSDASRVYFQMVNELKESTPKKLKYISDAIQIALIWNSEATIQIHEMMNTSDCVLDARRAAKGQILSEGRWLEIRWGIIYLAIISWFKDLINRGRRTAIVCLLMVISFQVSNWNLLGVKAEEMEIENEGSLDLSWCAPVLVWFATLIIKKFLDDNVTFVRPEIRWLRSSCVRNKDLLDINKNKGRVEPEWKFRDKTWDILNLTGEQASIKLGCDKFEKILAGQVGPIIRGTQYITPTIHHSCKQTQMAAAIRACSNKIEPDPTFFKKWQREFDKLGDRVVEAIWKEGGMDVNLDEWLEKYKVKYREEAYRELERPDLYHNKKEMEKMDLFSKTELQITDIEHSEKFEPKNTVKVRAITAPTTMQKIATNAFCYALEGVLHRNITEYCGRKDWPAICRTMDFGRMLIEDPVDGASDQSGYDMTLIKCYNDEGSKLVDKILWKAPVNVDTRTSKGIISKAFRQAGVLRVNVGQGAASFTMEGRGSGQGWTMCMNSLFMIAFWTTVFEDLKIPKSDRFLVCKSDDSVFTISRKWKALLDANVWRYFSKENKFGKIGLGQVCKFIKWGTLEDIDFLSNYMFRDSRGLTRMTRIPNRVFQTTPWSTKVLPGMNDLFQKCRELTWSKGSCMLAWAKGLPIFETYARKLMELGVQGELTDYNKYADEPRTWGDENDYDEMCDFLSHRFNLTREDIVIIEDGINSITHLYQEVVIPELDKLLI